MQNRSQVAGILSIISGVFGVLGLGWTLLWVYLFRSMFTAPGFPDGANLPDEFFTLMVFFYAAIGVVLALLGILGIVGGTFALKRRYWGLALAGAIAGAITFFPTGVAAIIFTVLAQPEFKTPGPVVPSGS